MATFKLKSELDKQYYFIEALTFRQGEKGHIIEWEVFNQGLPLANIGLYTITLKATTPNGHYIEQSGSITSASGSTFKITLPDPVTGEVGEFKRFYVELKSGDTVYTTPDIKVFVLPVADISSRDAQAYIDRVEAVIEQVLADYADYVNKIDQDYLDELLKLTNAFNTAKGELDKAVSDFKTQITNETNELSTKITNLTNQINTAINGMNDSIAEFQTTLTGLETRVDDLQTLMDDLVANGAMSKTQADAFYMSLNGVITTEDFNTLVDVGSYGLSTISGANKPAGITSGTLLVLGDSNLNGTVQVAIGDANLQFRVFNGTTWSSWTKAGADVNTNVYFRTWEDFLTDGREFSEFYVQGSYAVLLTGELTPTDSPVSEFEPPLMGWLEVNRMYNTGGSTTDLVMQKVYLPTIKKAFQRIQTNSVQEGQEANIQWSDWASMGGAEPATVDDIITGERNDVMVTPKALKEATQNDKQIEVGNWTPLALNTGFKSADETTVKYRITTYPDGKKYIEFDGAWTNNAGSIASNASTQSQWCILPAELRPAQTKMFPAQCSAYSTTGRIAFVNNGICYGAQNSGSAVTYMYVTGMGYWIGE